MTQHLRVKIHVSAVVSNHCFRQFLVAVDNCSFSNLRFRMVSCRFAILLSASNLALLSALWPITVKPIIPRIPSRATAPATNHMPFAAPAFDTLVGSKLSFIQSFFLKADMHPIANRYRKCLLHSLIFSRIAFLQAHRYIAVRIHHFNRHSQS
jgi:hypothetical protein